VRPGTSLGIISYARLARFIHSIGRRLQVKDNIFHAAIALGLMHIGAATISVGAAFPPDLHVDVVLTDTPETFANGRNAKVVIFAIFQ
jgi:hypothetical protein